MQHPQRIGADRVICDDGRPGTVAAKLPLTTRGARGIGATEADERRPRLQVPVDEGQYGSVTAQLIRC